MAKRIWRGRRGAKALARRAPPPGPELALAGLLALGLLIASAAAFGQSAPPDTAQSQTGPGQTGPGQTGPGQTGVIRPPPVVDPGIKAKPPVGSSALPTPVIPPPGTPGGNQSVQPR